jgi:hypothetical protein
MSKIYSAIELSAIKFRYRAALVCLLAFFLLGAWHIYLVHTLTQSPPYSELITLGCLITYILSIIFSFLLVTKVSSTAFGIVMAIFICLPLIGLLPVIFVLIKATFVLKNQKNVPSPEQKTAPAGKFLPEEIQRIAGYQKRVIFCILGNTLLPFLRVMLSPSFTVLFVIAMLVVWIASIVFTFRLAQSIYKKNMGVLMGILTLLPFVNIIAILKVNGSATDLLREEGVPVGFFGAKV